MTKYLLLSILFISQLFNCVNKNKTDPDFSLSIYKDFIKQLAENKEIIVVPLKDFDSTIDSTKIIIGLRHDVDRDIRTAKKMAKIENEYGIQSSYYILHTADYYLRYYKNKEQHSRRMLKFLKAIQNKHNHEIGWHNDLLTLQIIYNINPIEFFHNELDWLRKKGINIVGSASHGSHFCDNYGYKNNYFFKECYKQTDKYPNTDFVLIEKDTVYFEKATFQDFDLSYEAYYLNNNKYFSDASYSNSKRWSVKNFDFSELEQGDRVIILTHPIHWY